MSTATVAQICAAVRSTLLTLDPSHPHRRDTRWNPVEGVDMVPSADVRNVFVELSIAEGDAEGFGACISRPATLRLWTSYGGLSRTDVRDLVSSDGHQVWQALHRASIPGLPQLDLPNWEPEPDEGTRWGAHAFDCIVFLPLGL